MPDKEQETTETPQELAGEDSQNAAQESSVEPGASDSSREESDPASASGTAEELDDLRQKAAERDSFLEELRRTKADLDNYQKRVRRERPAWEEQAVGRFVRDLLPVVDNFERALESMNADSDVASIEQGVRLIHQMLRQVLNDNGVEEISAENEQFDPERHEAMVQEEVEDRPTGEVVEVLEKGYRYRSFVLRPSKVKVALNVKQADDEPSS